MPSEAKRAYNKAYYQKNRDKLLAEQKEREQRFEAANPGHRRAYRKAYQEANRESLNAAQRVKSKVHYQANKRAYRARNRGQRIKNYGLTPATLAAILEYQEHQCPICERYLVEQNVPSIDHCHVTGSVRGVLCRRCNAALGMLEDSAANVERALDYLSMPARQAFTRWLSGVTSTTSSAP
jgi:hypothetical protein